MIYCRHINDTVMRKTLVLLLWMLCCGVAYPQSIDSLRESFNRHSKHSVEAVDLASRIAYQFTNINQFDSAKAYLTEALRLAERRETDSLLAVSYDRLGVVYSRLSRNDSALVCFEKVRNMCRHLPHDSMMTVTVNHIGTVYLQRSDYVQATEYYLQALSLYDTSYGARLERRILGDLGENYLNQGDTETGLVYLNRIIDSHQKYFANDSSGLVYPLILVARAYDGIDNVQRAQQLFHRALTIAKQYQLNRRICDIWSNLGALYYLEFDQKEEAYGFWKNALVLAEREQYTYSQVGLLSNIGMYHASSNRLEQAIEYYQQALLVSEEVEDLRLRVSPYLNLADAYAELKQYKKAFTTMEICFLFKDSVLNTEKQRAIADLQVKYEAEKKQKVIYQLEEQKAQQTILLDRKIFFNRLLGSSIVVAILFIGVMAFFFIQLQRKNRVISQQQDRLLNQNQALQHSEKRLKKAYHTQSRFSSIIAHDLRSPITNLRVFLSMLQSCSNVLDWREQKRYLTLLNQELGNVELLLDNLLHWAIDQQDAIKFKPSKIDIEAVVEQGISLIQQQARIREISIVRDVVLAGHVRTDPDMLSYILRNLLTNAIKFTPPSGLIKLSAKITSGHVLLEVFNTGSTISDEEAINLFKLRTKPGMLPEDKKGVGLGLYLSKQFAHKMGGKLWVDIQADVGVSFFLSLPFQSSDHINVSTLNQDRLLVD